MTQREFEARMAWIEEEIDRPSREDWYLMQIAAEVCRTRVRNPQDVKLSDMKLRSGKQEVPQTMTKEEATARAKSCWFGMLGVGREKKHHGT